jgi:hypothetical protein
MSHTSLSSGTLNLSGALNITNGNIIVTSGNVTVSGSMSVGSSITTGAVYSTNITATNIVSTNSTITNIYSQNGQSLYLNASNNAIFFQVTGTIYGFYNTFSFAPQLDNTISLGGSGNRFTTLNLSSSITSGSLLISNGSLIAASNSHTLGNLYTTGGNVGINTSSPSAQLDVFSSNTFGNLYLGNNVQNRKLVLLHTVNNDHQFYGFGINTSSLRYQVDFSGASHDFYACTSATSSNLLMRIAGSGNVGIGTNSPNFLLSLGVITSSQKLALYDGGTNNFFGMGAINSLLHFHAGTTSGANGQMVLANTGYVGIGTSSPSYTLDVNGSARIGSAGTSTVNGTAFMTVTSFDTASSSHTINLFTGGNTNIDNFGAFVYVFGKNNQTSSGASKSACALVVLTKRSGTVVDNFTVSNSYKGPNVTTWTLSQSGNNIVVSTDSDMVVSYNMIAGC